MRFRRRLPLHPGGLLVTKSPLLIPPLLRLGSVGVLSSFSVAFAIIKVQDTQLQVGRLSGRGITTFRSLWRELSATPHCSINLSSGLETQANGHIHPQLEPV
jgi:hypothetical protein